MVAWDNGFSLNVLLGIDYVETVVMMTRVNTTK